MDQRSLLRNSNRGQTIPTKHEPMTAIRGHTVGHLCNTHQQSQRNICIEYGFPI